MRPIVGSAMSVLLWSIGTRETDPARDAEPSSILFVSGLRSGRDATSELRVMDASSRNARSLLHHPAPYAAYAPNRRL
jgi:hypothetical protein